MSCGCSVACLSLTLRNLMDCSTPGIPVLHYLLEFAQTRVHWAGDAIQTSISSPVTPFSSCPQSFPASGSFPMSRLFASGGQSIGASSGGSDGKEPACNAGDLGLIPGSGRSLEGGNGYPLQYPCMENPMDRGAWQAAVYGSQRVRHD